MVWYMLAYGVLKLGLELAAGPAVMPSQAEGTPLIFILISLLTSSIDWLLTHKAVRTGLNICKKIAHRDWQIAWDSMTHPCRSNVVVNQIIINAIDYPCKIQWKPSQTQWA